MTAFSGWGEVAHSAMPLEMARGVASIVAAGVPTTPLRPKPFTVPAQPIVPASSDGYLPSSWTVTPKGEFTFALPLAVPPGRAGMAPSLTLEYASGTGNGIVGVGWSVSGFSTITRSGRAWANHGETDGVDFSVRDRFYLDGQELVGVDAAAYGGNGAEYRTASDTFVRVHSTSAEALDPMGPEEFTVELGDGRTRTYAAVTAQQITFDKDNNVFAHGPVRAAWRIVSEVDASGNAMLFEYDDVAGPGGANAADYWYDQRPSKILYTANLTNGLPTHGLQDLPQRYVAFEYEDRPDARAGWQAGVQRKVASRLKAIKMYAPNPTATAEVWRYTLSYTAGTSERSLLSSVQRCESVGGCLWAKQFAYSPAANLPSFKEQPVLSDPIPASTYDLSWTSAPEGEVPAMQVLDVNGDGASDLLFGAGTGMVWEHIAVANQNPPFDIKRTGKFLGGSHSLWMSERDANGHIVPLSLGLSLPRDEDPLATANYGHVRLDEATVADLDGDGKDELIAAIDNLEAHELVIDPQVPPFKPCSFADLKWTGSGFVRMHATSSCTLVGSLADEYHYYLPNELPLMVDINGDGLADRVQSFNAAGWIGSNNPNDIPQFEYTAGWKIALNLVDVPGQFAVASTYGNLEASAGVVTDLNGDGRPELTSEALKSSLTFDDASQWTKQVPDS
ncbi:MAG: SpvB/TcaC N-terminal domain-containing protein, partial [Rhodanobacteraceae bacterium]